MLMTSSIRLSSRSKEPIKMREKLDLLYKITLITGKYINNIYIASSCVVIEDLNFREYQLFKARQEITNNQQSTAETNCFLMTENYVLT